MDLNEFLFNKALKNAGKKNKYGALYNLLQREAKTPRQRKAVSTEQVQKLTDKEKENVFGRFVSVETSALRDYQKQTTLKNKDAGILQKAEKVRAGFSTGSRKADFIKDKRKSIVSANIVSKKNAKPQFEVNELTRLVIPQKEVGGKQQIFNITKDGKTIYNGTDKDEFINKFNKIQGSKPKASLVKSMDDRSALYTIDITT